MDTLAVVLSSTVVSALVSSAFVAWSSLRAKQNEYTNAYYKLVLYKRVAAYEEVERFIVSIKVAVVDDTDRKPYHLLFSKDEDIESVYQQLYSIMSKSLWLSDDLYKLTQEMNFMVYGCTKDRGLIEFGKENYTKVAELRTKIEAVHSKDMLCLHEVEKFLAAKKQSDSYVSLPPRV